MKRKSEDDRGARRALSFRMGIARWNIEAGRELVNRNTPHPPVFFVSVAFKRLSDPVSSLDATLTRGFISVDSK